MRMLIEINLQIIFFRFNNASVIPEYLINEINNFIHEYISIESLSDLNKQKLTDETFIKIIDIIPKYKAKNYKSWTQFVIICSILQYLLVYFDYFSQKDNYGGERNIDEYNKIYKRAFNDQYVKDEKFQEKTKIEIYYGNRILRDWIKEEDPDYFKELEIQIIKFSCKQVATYMLNKMNKAKFKYIKTKWYCCNEK